MNSDNFFWEKYNTDKISGHGYQEVYDTFLDRSSKVIVEFGSRPGSAQLWHDYFYSGSVYCCDIVSFTPKLERSYFLHFDMNLEHNYNSLPDSIDVAIEDGPHTSKSQLLAISNLIPKLRKGGVIVLEDLHCTEPQYASDYITFKGDSDITVNELLEEWSNGNFNDYRYINGSEFKDLNLHIEILRGSKKRWSHMDKPSQIGIIKKI